MKKLLKKDLSKPTIVRLTIVGIILLLDILIVPWLLKLPFYVGASPNEWLKYGPFRAIWAVITETRFRMVYLFTQLPIATLIVAIAWDVKKIKKKNYINDGVGGPEPTGNGQHGTSRWQTYAEVEKNFFSWETNKELRSGGIVLGVKLLSENVAKLWIVTKDLHTAIWGATRSGKDRKILLPTIYVHAKAEECMVIGDPKGDQYIYAKPFLESEGYKVIALNIRDPLLSNQWNILDPVNKAVDSGDFALASKLAKSIANTLATQKPNAKMEPIWENGNKSVITTVILLTAMESQFKFQRHMGTAYNLLSQLGVTLEDGTVPLVEYIDQLPSKHPAKATFATAKMAPYKTRASFFTNALSDLWLFSDPLYADMTSKQDHDLESIGIEKTAVFLIIPDEDSTMNVLATLYIDQLYNAQVKLANKRGGRIPRRIHFLLNEFGNLPAIPDFPKKLTIAGSRGMRFTIAMQDQGQLLELYGENATRTILGNCHTWIFIKTADTKTADLISEKTGKYTTETDNSSSSVQNKGHSITHGVGLTGRALLMPDEILRWKNNQTLILTDNFPARLPAPDIAEWFINDVFGLAKPSGNLDADMEENNRIVLERWQNHIPREFTEVSIWVPEFITDDDEDGDMGILKVPPLQNNPKNDYDVDPETGEVLGQAEVAGPSDISLESILSNVEEEDAKDDNADFL